MNYQLNRLAPELQKREKLVSAVTLAVLITVIWCWYDDCSTFAAWKMPIGYGCGGWLIFGLARAYILGETFPVFLKMVSTPNAPLVANWNDYPVAKDLIYAGIGLPPDQMAAKLGSYGFVSPGEPVLARNGDNRKLSFKLIGFRFIPVPC